MQKSGIYITAVAVCLAGATSFAQFGAFRQDVPNPPPQYPQAEFHFARLAYDSHGQYAGSRGMSMPMWSIDYPYAEEHFLPALERFTRVNTLHDSAHVQLMDDELYDYPWLLIQQLARGYWDPTDLEVERLREYLYRGGFLVVDDIHGEGEWRWFEDVIARVLPGRPIVDLLADDAVLNIVFDVDSRTQIPGERQLSYNGTANKDGPPHWAAIYDDDGRMIVAINHNIDMGDAWEHADDPRYPVEMTALSYRFGVNYVIYAMTH
jgi:hypothetical protein